MARDTYKEDLAKENYLGINFLDSIYKENDIFGPNYEYQRITDIEEQHKGIDLKVVEKETGCICRSIRTPLPFEFGQFKMRYFL